MTSLIPSCGQTIIRIAPVATSLGMVKEAPMVMPTTFRAYDKALCHTERALLRIRELGPPVHGATAIAQAAAHNPKALAALARLDLSYKRSTHSC